MGLIGRGWKLCEEWSRPVLIGRGLALNTFVARIHCVTLSTQPCSLCHPCVLFQILHSGRVASLLVSPRPISTSHLHRLLGFQFWPINPMVCGGPYPLEGGEKPHLGTGFPLRCFQRLSLPNVANQRCSWWNNWHTRGSSVPVLSY